MAKKLVEAVRFLENYEALDVVLGSNAAIKDGRNVARTVLRSELQQLLPLPTKFPFHELTDSDLGQLGEALLKLEIAVGPWPFALSAELLARTGRAVNQPADAAGFVKAVTDLAAAPGVSVLNKKALWSVIGERIDLPSGAKAVSLRALTLQQVKELGVAFQKLGLNEGHARVEAELLHRAGQEFMSKSLESSAKRRANAAAEKAAAVAKLAQEAPSAPMAVGASPLRQQRPQLVKRGPGANSPLSQAQVSNSTRPQVPTEVNDGAYGTMVPTPTKKLPAKAAEKTTPAGARDSASPGNSADGAYTLGNVKLF
ncbi:MAG: hypothetical protein H7255_02515 [Ramlibacter sp.]|nr:hypothetical protein [Ramlibacter sp.]